MMGKKDSQTSLETLIQKAGDGDKGAFGILFEQTQGAVRSFLWQREHDPDALDDLVQRTYLIAFRALSGLRNSERLTSWLLTIAHNEWRRWVKTEVRKPEQIEEFDIMAKAVPSRQEISDRQVNLARAIQHLSGRERQLLHLRFEKGLACSEIAGIFRKPAGTIRSKLHRTITKLQRMVRTE
ncbi:RNA polymerase sigma factor [Planctomycetota bacterium]